MQSVTYMAEIIIFARDCRDNAQNSRQSINVNCPPNLNTRQNNNNYNNNIRPVNCNFCNKIGHDITSLAVLDNRKISVMMEISRKRSNFERKRHSFDQPNSCCKRETIVGTCTTMLQYRINN